jgi:Fanconi anaemia protein FancD2 nuclease
MIVCVNTVLLHVTQEGHKFVEAFLKTMPFLEASFKEHQKSVLGLLKDLQSSTRQVH